MTIDTINTNEPPGHDLRTRLFDRCLDIMNPINVLDLAAGHCQFSLRAAPKADRVTAMDIRTVRVPAKLPANVTFIEGNILDLTPRRLADFEPDVILVLGILYHLTIPEQDTLFKTLAGHRIILDTHTAANQPAYATEKGYTGIYYQEAKNMTALKANPKASGTSLLSFWHTEFSLVRMLQRHGWKMITKVLPEHYPDRSFYLLEP